MRLSEAIRLGATMGPQVFGVESDGKGGTCAGYGAMIAAGYKGDMRHGAATDFLRKEFPIWFQMALYPGMSWAALLLVPKYNPYRAGIGSIVIALNDHDHWSRDRIADWVEQEELRIGELKPLEDLADPIFWGLQAYQPYLAAWKPVCYMPAPQKLFGQLTSDKSNLTPEDKVFLAEVAYASQ